LYHHVDCFDGGIVEEDDLSNHACATSANPTVGTVVVSTDLESRIDPVPGATNANSIMDTVVDFPDNNSKSRIDSTTTKVSSIMKILVLILRRLHRYCRHHHLCRRHLCHRRRHCCRISFVTYPAARLMTILVLISHHRRRRHRRRRHHCPIRSLV